MIRKVFFIIIFLLCTTNIAFSADGIIVANDYIMDIKNGEDRTYNDKSIRLDIKQVYVVGYLGDWQSGFEVGGYIKDKRRSAYEAMLRIRENDQTYKIGTDQVLKLGFVGKVDLRYIHVEGIERPEEKSKLFVYGLGFDKYYGDYHYFTTIFYNDPRESRRFSVVISNTFATKDSYLRLGIVPRSDGTTGYFGVTKYHWLFVGYSYTREFDFTALDRKVFTFGLRIPFDLKWNTQDQ